MFLRSLGLAFLGALALQSGVTASETIHGGIIQVSEPAPIIASINRLSKRSKHVYIEATIPKNDPNQLFFNDNTSKLVLDITGAEFDSDNDVTIVATSNFQSPTCIVTSSLTTTKKPKKDQVKVKINWPAKKTGDEDISRKLLIKAKVDDVEDLGLVIRDTSQIRSSTTTIKFAEVTSPTAVSIGKLSTSFRPLTGLKTTDQLAEIDFELKKIVIPDPLPADARVELSDVLGNAKIVGKEGSGSICTILGKTDIPLTANVRNAKNGALQFDLASFANSTDNRVHVRCSTADVKINFGSSDEPLDQIWTLQYVNPNDQSVYLADDADLHLTKSPSGSKAFAVFLVIIITIALAALVVFGLKKMQLGPFKPKRTVADSSDAQQQPINYNPPSEGYETVA